MTTAILRRSIRDLVSSIETSTEEQCSERDEIVSWIESGAGLFRTSKPATPPTHLIVYFVLIDDDYILLVDHINSGLWLPPGGHVDDGEHPSQTVIREAMEELSIVADFICPTPLLARRIQTVGLTAGHTDVCLWYALRGSRNEVLNFDRREFHSTKWFHINDIPYEASDPHLQEFVSLIAGKSANR